MIAYGVQVNHLLKAADLLAEKGIRAAVLKMNRISPLDDQDVLCASIGQTKKLLVLEDALGAGCVGQRIAGILALHGMAPEKLILKNLGKTFAPEGSVTELEHSFGLDAEAIAAAVLEA